MSLNKRFLLFSLLGLPLIVLPYAGNSPSRPAANVPATPSRAPRPIISPRYRTINKRNSLVGLLIIVLGIIMGVIPAIIGIDGFNGGFALSLFGVFVVIVGVITILMFVRLARLQDRILRKENILAHWTYSAEEWRQYTEEEHSADKNDKWRLFLMVAVMAVIAGIILWVIYPRDLVLDICIILEIIVFIALTAYLSSFTPYLWNKQQQCEAYLAKDGAFLNSRLHIWNGLGTRLVHATYEEDAHSLPRIRIEYSSENAAARNYYSARIPVPRGQEEAARTIVARIQASHHKK